MPRNFADRLLDEIDSKKSHIVVGLDPRIESIPKQFLTTADKSGAAEAFYQFNRGIIDAIYDLVCAVKPNSAFYEGYGPAGISALERSIDYAHSRGLLVIEDAKRNDIGSTSKAYADGHLGHVATKLKTDSGKCFTGNASGMNADAMTINPYLGRDGLTPFVDVCKENGKGAFILVKTSNRGSGDLQDRLVAISEAEDDALREKGVDADRGMTELYNLVASQVDELGKGMIGERGYSSIGAVVGATYPQQAETLRRVMPNAIILVPGYGAQGGGAKDTMPNFNGDGYGAVVNNSRGIIFAYLDQENPVSPERYQDASRQKTLAMKSDLESALRNNDKLPASWMSS